MGQTQLRRRVEETGTQSGSLIGGVESSPERLLQSAGRLSLRHLLRHLFTTIVVKSIQPSCT